MHPKGQIGNYIRLGFRSFKGFGSLNSQYGNRVHFDDFEVQWSDDLAVQPRSILTTSWVQIKGSFR